MKLKFLLPLTQAELEGGILTFLVYRAVRGLSYVAIGALFHYGWNLIA